MYEKSALSDVTWRQNNEKNPCPSVKRAGKYKVRYY